MPTVSCQYIYPPPHPSNTATDVSKKYLWCCHWLTGKDDLIYPLSDDNLRQAFPFDFSPLNTCSLQFITKENFSVYSRSQVEHFLRKQADEKKVNCETPPTQTLSILGEVDTLSQVVGTNGNRGAQEFVSGMVLPGEISMTVDDERTAWSDSNDDDPDWSDGMNEEFTWNPAVRSRRNRNRRSQPGSTEQPTTIEVVSPSSDESMDEDNNAVRRSERQRQRRRQERHNMSSLESRPYVTHSVSRFRTSRRLRLRSRLQKFASNRNRDFVFQRVLRRRAGSLSLSYSMPNFQQLASTRSDISRYDRQEDLRQRLIRSLDYAVMVINNLLRCCRKFFSG